MDGRIDLRNAYGQPAEPLFESDFIVHAVEQFPIAWLPPEEAAGDQEEACWMDEQISRVRFRLIKGGRR